MKNTKINLNWKLFLSASSILLGVSSAFGQCTPDVTAPDPIVLPDLTGECAVTAIAPTTTDFCDGTVTGITADPITYISEGFYIINWTFMDLAGNSIIVPQNIIVDDVTNPVPNISSLGDLSSECSITPIPPTALDNCAGVITGITATPFPVTTQGTTVVTWTYDDGNGNVITQDQNVILDDVSAPIESVGNLPDINAECEITSLTAPTAIDNCSGTIYATTGVTFPISAQGTTLITWIYDDGNGNISTQTQNVVINDMTNPVLDVPSLPDVNLVCQITSLIPPTASDNCTGIITATNNAVFPITYQGETTIVWTFDDGNGNFVSQNQKVILTDDVAPIPDSISLPDLLVECEITSLVAPTATDNCVTSVNATHDVILPMTVQGSLMITWTFDDGNGNQSTQSQLAIINDITPPIPDAIILPDLTASCELTSLTAPTATDNCNGFIQVTHDAQLPISTIDNYVITWMFEDPAGNVTAQTQNVIIEDIEGPVVDLNTVAPITVDCQLVSLTEPTYTDACGSAVIVSHDAQLPISAEGNTTIEWMFTDEFGNTTLENQEVTIVYTGGCLDLVTVNDVITSNGDDKNDYWVLENVGYIQDCSVQIFNRWGTQVYESIGYDNSWNGISAGGEKLPEGVYFYIIQCSDEVSFRGYITLLK